MAAKNNRASKTMTEEIQVAGGELLDRVKALLSEGRVRHIRVKSPTGELYFELPLAVGVIGGAALAVASPWLAMAGSLAGLVASVKIEVIRENDEMVALVEPEFHAETAPEREMRTAKQLTRRPAPKRAATGKRAAAAIASKPRVAKTRKVASPGAKRAGARRRSPTRGGRGKTRGRR